MNYDHLYQQLSQDLRPVRRLPSHNKLLMIWLLAVIPATILLFLLTGNLRPNLVDHLKNSLQFDLELAIGLITPLIAAYGALHLNRPTPSGLEARSHRWPLFLAAAFVLLICAGIIWSQIEPSMLGKRPHCISETFLYSLPPAAVLFLLTFRGYSVNPLISSILFGISSAMIPVMGMHLACMYSHQHILLFHLGPGLFSATSLALLYAAATGVRHKLQKIKALSAKKIL